MKLRKILCLSLAAAVTFTLAINLTVSAQIGGENANENQSFGCIILDKMRNEKSDNDNSGISPLWTGDTHDEIIMGGDSNYIPAAYSDLVYKICKWCDDETKIPFATCLHGNRNYVATLKFLWTYAQKISVNSGEAYHVQSSNAKSQCLAMFDKQKFDNLNSYDKQDYVHLVKLADTTEYVINTYGKFKNGEGRKYLIVGLIMHFLGDVTAHRTIVPKFMIDRATDSNYTNSINRFNKKDFSNAEWNKLITEYNNGSLDFSLIQNLLIKRSGETDEDLNKRKVSIRKRYEDNPSVVPNRILQSETMVDYFFHYFNNGFDDSIFDSSYSNINLIYLNNKYKRQI